MGTFLSTSGILSPDGNAVKTAIESFVTSAGGTFNPHSGTINDPNIGVLQSSEVTTTVLYRSLY